MCESRLQVPYAYSALLWDFSYKTEIKDQMKNFRRVVLEPEALSPGPWTAALATYTHKASPGSRWGLGSPGTGNDRTETPDGLWQFEVLIKHFYLCVPVTSIPWPFANLVCHPCPGFLSILSLVCHYVVI